MWFGRKSGVVLCIMAILILVPQIVVLHEAAQIKRYTIEYVKAESTDDAGSGSSITHLLDQFNRLDKEIMGSALISSLGILMVIYGLYGSKKFFRNIVMEIDALAGKMDATSYFVKTSSRLLADDANRQSSAIGQTVKVHKSITVLSRNNAEHAKDGTTKIHAYAQTIDSANKTLEQLMISMDDIIAAGQQIKHIVHDIEDIAAKTNVLAINAGVESVKAGASGSTFGVIAEEIRDLSQKASQSANQTGTLILTTIQKINKGADTVSQVADAFKETRTQVEEVQISMDAITDAAQDQSRQLNRLETAVDELESLTARQVDNSRETGRISEALQRNSEELRVLVGNIISQTVSRKAFSDDALTRTLGDLQMLASRLTPAGIERTDHRIILNQWKASVPYPVEAIYSCSHDGHFIYSNPPAAISDARMRQWWQKAISGKPYISPVYISAINKKPCCTISVPLNATDNAISGVLGMDLKV